MSTDLTDLRAVLAARAATTDAEVAAARARFDTVRTVPVEPERTSGTQRSRRGPRLVAISVVATAVVVLISSVVAVTARRPGPPAEDFAASLDPSLALTQWLFTVRTAALPTDLDVVEYGHVDRNRQVAFVLRPGDAATSNRYTALVELTAAAVARPRNATREAGGWSARASSDEWGVSGWQLVWTDPAGFTLRVVAPDLDVARALRDATEVGVTHPVRFPMRVATRDLPAGSQVESVEFVGVEGITARLSVPGSPDWQLSVASSGVYLDAVREGTADVDVSPFAAGFSRATSAGLDATSAVLTSAAADVRVIVGDPGDPVRPGVTDTALRALLTGARFATFPLHPDQEAWFPLADALPTG
ncbi:hypothetical protein ACXR2U_11365 [Jatrophihabitans sp. YIM 134969]